MATDYKLLKCTVQNWERKASGTYDRVKNSKYNNMFKIVLDIMTYESSSFSPETLLCLNVFFCIIVLFSIKKEKMV